MRLGRLYCIIVYTTIISSIIGCSGRYDEFYILRDSKQFDECINKITYNLGTDSYKKNYDQAVLHSIRSDCYLSKDKTLNGAKFGRQAFDDINAAVDFAYSSGSDGADDYLKASMLYDRAWLYWRCTDIGINCTEQRALGCKDMLNACDLKAPVGGISRKACATYNVNKKPPVSCK